MSVQTGINLVSEKRRDPTPLVSAATADNLAPDDREDGAEASGWSFTVISAQSVGGTSFDFEVWTYTHASGLWCLDTRLGTSGVVTVTTATNGGKIRNWIQTLGADQVYVRVTNFSGGSAATVWVEGANEVR